MLSVLAVMMLVGEAKLEVACLYVQPTISAFSSGCYATVIESLVQKRVYYIRLLLLYNSLVIEAITVGENCGLCNNNLFSGNMRSKKKIDIFFFGKIRENLMELTYCKEARSWSVSEEIVFYETRRFVTRFTMSRHLSVSLTWLIPPT
jgi:hypothetical protein